jgi:cytochrome P450
MLTEAIALDLMFVLLFASFETTSLALTYAIKLLSDNPLVFKQLQVRYRYIILSESLEQFFMALQDRGFYLPRYFLLGRT